MKHHFYLLNNNTFFKIHFEIIVFHPTLLSELLLGKIYQHFLTNHIRESNCAVVGIPALYPIVEQWND